MVHTMAETKQEYCDRITLYMPREMKQILDSLAVPCECGLTVCRGWRLMTMLRAELPPTAWTARPKERR